MEIGSEFWLDDLTNGQNNGIPRWIGELGETVLTSSGRGAISLLLKSRDFKSKKALLPAYICDSVISPFINNGFSCSFYDINEDMTPNIDSIGLHDDIGIFFHMGYFGFGTNRNLEDILNSYRQKSTVIIEDITHSLFSNTNRFYGNDYMLASLRKWTGLPSGGFLVSKHNDIFNEGMSENEAFANIRRDALLTKGMYMKNNDMTLKNRYLELFSMAEKYLENDMEPHPIDVLSRYIINHLDISEIVEKRRNNYTRFSRAIEGIRNMEHVFGSLSDNICPFFYPLFIEGKRDDIRRKLINQDIYCAVHWKLPDALLNKISPATEKIYKSVISIPCDQRYSSMEVERIASVLKHIMDNGK